MKRIVLLTVAVSTIFAAVSCTESIQVPERVDIIPMPQSLILNDGAFAVSGSQFYCAGSIDENSLRHIETFATKLGKATGKRLRLHCCESESGFCFAIDEGLNEEEYSIDIDQECVKVKAGGSNGMLYAIQSISQMLPVEYFTGRKSTTANWALRCVSIKDTPRFAYRGMHLDVCRHYFSVEEIKKYLDVMALHKMNRMHWHLTEDQGWRIEIKKYPKLTELGSIRQGTMMLKDWGSNDGIPYGGYYTQDEVRDVISYADNLGIVIIPEIDLPGHMMGALHAYPELGCTGGPYEVWTQWGISDQVLCPGKEITFEFLEDVLDEIMDLFPSEYIHIGGDECPKVEWQTCPDCQRRIKELGIKGDREHSAETLLQNYVTARIQKYVNEKGRKIIGWDEILEGELAEGATVMSWRGVDGGIEAAKKGFDVIMTPSTYCYFDYYQSDNTDLEPLAIGGYLPIEKVYTYEPYEGIPENAWKHILGVQANVWTEYIAKPEHLEYMVLPRMDAVSEVQWCQAGTKDFDRLKESLSHMGEIYDVLGYSWCKAVFGEYGLPVVPGGTN